MVANSVTTSLKDNTGRKVVYIDKSEVPTPWDNWKGLMEYAGYNVEEEKDKIKISWNAERD